MKQLSKDPDFTIEQSCKNNTIKVTHKESGELYSVHPADQAIRPLDKWVQKHKN
jgi:hypothetical protein